MTDEAYNSEGNKVELEYHDSNDIISRSCREN